MLRLGEPHAAPWVSHMLHPHMLHLGEPHAAPWVSHVLTLWPPSVSLEGNSGPPSYDLILHIGLPPAKPRPLTILGYREAEQQPAPCASSHIYALPMHNLRPNVEVPLKNPGALDLGRAPTAPPAPTAPLANLSQCHPTPSRKKRQGCQFPPTPVTITAHLLKQKSLIPSTSAGLTANAGFASLLTSPGALWVTLCTRHV